MWTRRKFLGRTGLGLLGVGGLALAQQGDRRPDGVEALPDGSASRGMVTPRAEKAIENGLKYLERYRNRTDGSFGMDKLAGNVAVTGLSALAFMANGAQPGRGPQGRLVTDALRFVLNQSNRVGQPDGYLNNPSASPHGPMYSHGFGTLFLGEVSGMVQEPNVRREVHDKLRKAVKVIMGAQNSEGGWRYFPKPNDADISVTVCQMMALRSAHYAGVELPPEWRPRSVDYVLRCQDRIGGWFRYMQNGSGAGGQQGFARTAAGVAALNGAGYYRNSQPPPEPAPGASRDQVDAWRKERDRTDQAREAIKKGLDFLMQYRPVNGSHRPDYFYFYGQYYAVQAMWTAGAAGGDYWKDWFPAIRDDLLASQQSDGSWGDPLCRHYGTAMACIILQVPNNYLPILQK